MDNVVKLLQEHIIHLRGDVPRNNQKPKNKLDLNNRNVEILSSRQYSVNTILS